MKEGYLQLKISELNDRINEINQKFSFENKKIELLESMLENFNEGRSKSFYCIATALLPIEDIEKALKESVKRIQDEKIDEKDLKTKSIILKEKLTKLAKDKYLDLKLKRK